jgi:ABC-type antimicrobial peptide transport system permease subunit
VVEGKDFDGVPADTGHVMLNKAAVAAMGVKNPLGMKLRYGRTEYNVTGITDNVVMESPFKPVDPVMTFYNSNVSSFVSIRLKDDANLQKSLASMEKIFNQYNPAFPFTYSFVDEEFSKKFVNEQLISRITNIFAGLAIFICCIGLAGLASFTIEKRTREIGIRKVLGASVQQLLALISQEFLKLVVIAFVIAVPISWWLMHNWLENYDFRVQITWWLFCSVGLLVLLLALVVVCANTMKAALRNPVTTLRTE